MQLFRLAHERFKDSLSGRGAALKGGRWNSPGTEVIYTASNRSLAMAEVLVHFPLYLVPHGYYMLTIEVQKGVSYKKLKMSDLPEDWNSFPAPETCMGIGDSFIAEQKSCLLYVPSAVTKGDWNVLINGDHPDFKKIEIVDAEPFPFDHRFFNPTRS